MAKPPVCPQCGSTNPFGAQFCQNCGGSLTAAKLTLPPIPSPSAPTPTSRPSTYGSRDYALLYDQGDRNEKVDRTKNGLLLLIIAAIIGFVPIIGTIIGGIMAIIGAALVILGRDPFG